MKDEPETIKISKEEKTEVFQNRVHSNYEELQLPKESLEEIPDRKNNNIEDSLNKRKKNIELGALQEKYQTIFENYAIAITLVDNNERIISWNTYTEELLGMDQNDLFMRPVKTLYPPEEWVRIRTENIRKKGIKYRMETKMIRKKELRPFDVEISLCVLKGEKGNIIGSIGIIKDITKQKEMERALVNSEEKFKQLYEKAPVPYHTLSPDGVITDVNEKWCQTLGYTKDEVIGKSIFEFIDPCERESAKASFTKKLQSKQFYSVANERSYVTKKNEKRVFVIRDYFSFDDDNTVTAIYTIMDDVTELKKAEEELKKTDAVRANIRRLQTVIDRVEDSITLSDTKGNFELFNSKMQEITGYTIEEANRCGDFTNLLYPDVQERKKALDNINETVKKGVSRNFETTIQTKDGIKKTLLVSTSIIELDNREMFLSVYHDITERKKMEQLLYESTAMYETLINASPEAISVFDIEGRFIYVSPQTLKLHGYEKKEDLLGHSAFELIAPEEHASAMNILQQITKTSILRDLQYTALRKDGTRFPLEGSAVVIKDQYGNPKSFISVTRDVTERKKVQEEIKYLKEYNENILESNPNPMMVVKGNQIEYVNKSFISMFGETKKEYVTKNLKDVIPSEIFLVFENLLKDGGKPKELKFKNRDYSIYSFVIKKAEEEEEEERRGIVFQDITNRKEAEEELKEKIEELERYKNATVGRELRMIELKKRIEELEQKLKNTPYLEGGIHL